MDDPSGDEGDVIYLHLFMDTLYLQTLVDGQDAWKADTNRYGGRYECILRKAFGSHRFEMNHAHHQDHMI
ncbi:hypothetical protein F5146DRAFT_937803 [Armillaria mellea]|nr:hypothetical protein F5146DRAFT_937803 [Armillaria mellea]